MLGASKIAMELRLAFALAARRPRLRRTEDRNSAPVVVYTYGLSPFSTECKAFLDGVGCKYEAIELGPEWFLLGPKASAMRAELAAETGQSSLPHVFIKGKSAGGLYSGNDVGEGLAALQKSGELTKMLKAAHALRLKSFGATL